MVENYNWSHSVRFSNVLLAVDLHGEKMQPQPHQQRGPKPM